MLTQLASISPIKQTFFQILKLEQDNFVWYLDVNFKKILRKTGAKLTDSKVTFASTNSYSQAFYV